MNALMERLLIQLRMAEAKGDKLGAMLLRQRIAALGR